MIHTSDFFDISNLDPIFVELLELSDYPWDILKNIPIILSKYLKNESGIFGSVDKDARLINKSQIYIGSGTIVEAGAYIIGPAYIGKNCEVRHGAYIRGNVIVGSNCVLGHTSEFKNSVMLNESHAPHFAYVGDSVLGSRVNLGAGTKLSNLGIHSTKDKISGERPTIRINVPEISQEPIDTGLSKMGAILGDDVQTGCNVTTNPGCLIGKRTIIYANLSLLKGFWQPNQIIKLRQNLIVVERQ
jgi:UDP-N-acetylglucosamine diphosphorylase / glucose-1-phosphate thymidylyltransferase / UDP-N-acetylgalactosamine diphosphorylase / glucosamine-1-phosphate N-acetyltransferase / galactosamine-1-phosphate N-acetyltransferase